MQSTKLKNFNIAKGLAMGTGGLLLAAAQPALAQQNPTIENLQTQIQEMQVQMDELERDVIVPDAPGSFMLPGTDTSMKIGGYVKADAIYDFDQDMGDSLFVQGLETGDVAEDSSFRAHARQSRLNVSTSTPTDVGPVTTFVEVDFFGGGGNELFSNSRGVRLRHAYGTHSGWLAGQTWSNFMQFTAYPTTVDFDGPVGVTFIRQAQLRYTAPVANGALSFSIENPETTGFVGSRDTLPDLTARYKGSFGNLGLEAGAVGRMLQTDGQSATKDILDSDGDVIAPGRSAVDADDDAFAYGLMLAGSLQVTDSTRIMASGLYGDGIGRYMYTNFSNSVSRAGGDIETQTNAISPGRDGIGEAYIDDSGNLETIEAYSFNVAVAQQWTPQLSSGLSYGYVEGDQDSDRFPVSIDTLQSIHFSNFYQVTDPVVVGLELSYADKELKNGESGDNTRLHASVQYSF